MKRTQSLVSSIIASSLVFGSLGFSGFVGAVKTMADDRDAASRTVRKDQIEFPTTGSFKTEDKVVRASRTSRETDLGTNRQRLGVSLSKDGMVSGRLNVSDSVTGAHVAADKLNIKFVQRGSIVSEAKPGPGGVFHVQGLNAGLYSMIASGPDGLFVCGVLVSPYAGEPELGTQDPLQIDATVVHPANVAAARKLIVDRISSTGRGLTSTKRTQAVEASVRRSNDGAPPIHTPLLTVDASGKVMTRINELDPATTDRRPAAGATVYMIQRGTVRGTYPVNDDGSFNAPGLVGGQYSLVAVSRSSKPTFAALGVIVEEQGSNSNTVNTASKDSTRMLVQPAKVTRLQGGSDIDMIPSTDFSSTQDPESVTDQQQQQPAGGAVTGGGGGGFGGGGGGFGGLGLIGAGLGAAGLAAALANQNNNNNNPSSPSK